MDFNDTPDEARFRAEVRAFLDANAELRREGEPELRSGEDSGAEALARAKAWHAKKFDAGFAGITWDKRWHGRGGTPIQQVIYGQEEARYQVPRGFFDIGLGMCIPTMIAYTTPEQLERYVRPALRGEEIWCQLFSEPSAGSDVAGLRTRGERVSGAPDADWILNGQKVWTSGAHYSDYGIVLVRTDPSVPKHAGLTMFFIDMKSPGIEVRPIKQILGTSNFNEVYFHDVRVSDSQRLGPVGGGWKVSITTLMNERLAVGQSPGPDAPDIMRFVCGLQLEGRPALADEAVRERLAEWYVQAQGLKYTQFRTMTALSRGQTPGPEASITKIVSANKLQAIASFGIDLLGQAGAVTEEDLVPLRGWFQQALLYAPGMRIAGGTDEILRNIIAERVLGMPGDVRVDKDRPFNAPQAKV